MYWREYYSKEFYNLLNSGNTTASCSGILLVKSSGIIAGFCTTADLAVRRLVDCWREDSASHPRQHYLLWRWLAFVWKALEWKSVPRAEHTPSRFRQVDKHDIGVKQTTFKFTPFRVTDYLDTRSGRFGKTMIHSNFPYESQPVKELSRRLVAT